MAARIPAPDSVMNELVAAVHAADTIIVFTGAGASAESGIPTFRGSAASWWAGLGGIVVLPLLGTSYGLWRFWPSAAWPLYDRGMRRAVLAARPNDFHKKLAQWLYAGKDVRVITQNVDGLHQRAGIPKVRVAEVHGTLWRNVCCACKAIVDEVDPVTIADDVYEAHAVSYCSACGGNPRPDATLFGERCPPIELDLMDKLAVQSGNTIVLIVGLSGIVSTCDWNIHKLRECPTFIIDPVAPTKYPATWVKATTCEAIQQL